MSWEYDRYLFAHRENVAEAYYWIKENLPMILTNGRIENVRKMETQICVKHDLSKYDEKEYDAYDSYFYGINKSYEVKQNFNQAWLHHIHDNKHHWQYWVLVNDDKDEGTIALDMPYRYVIEMICDWWSFSFESGNLYSIFDWYDQHKDYIILSPLTKSDVENILASIKEKLDETEKSYELEKGE